MASWAGYQVTACGLGMGHSLLRLPLRHTILYICWPKPYQGLTFSQPTRSDHSARAEAALLSGGLLAHLLWIAVSWPLYLRFDHWLLAVALGLNTAYLLVGLIPIRFRLGEAVIESDARRILRVLCGKGQSSTTAERLLIYRQCIDHLAVIRDPIGSFAYRTELAFLELDCGQLDAAAELLEQHPAPDDCPSYLRGRFELARFMICSGRSEIASGPLAAARAAFGTDRGGLLTCELLDLEQTLTGWRRSGDRDPDALLDLTERIRRMLQQSDLPAWVAKSGSWLNARAQAHLGRFDEARRSLGDHPEPTGWLAAWIDGLAATHPREALARHLAAIRCLAPRITGLSGKHRTGYLESHEGLGGLVGPLAAELGDIDALSYLSALLGAETPAPEPIESHYGVLAGCFLTAGLVVDLVAWWAFSWATPELLRLMITIGATCCFAGIASAIAALFTRDRKRTAIVSLVFGLPAAAFSLQLIERLGRLLYGS